MNKKHYLMTIVMMLTCSITLSAATITKDEARRQAQQFLTQRQGAVAASRTIRQAPLKLAKAADELYVFNVGQQEGFVIVSGDDNTAEPILGYADQGTIDSDNMPDNLRAWLQGYADQIRWMREHGVSNSKAESRQARVVKKSISPLLATQWNQYAPYNNNCPQYAAKVSEGVYSATATVTGCVATATAQLMYYHARKNSISSTTMLKGTPQYPTENLLWVDENHVGKFVNAKDAATINWAVMTDTYPSTNEANAEVAKLMEYIGAAVKMQYGIQETGGSSASNEAVPTALSEYFGYDADIKSVYRNNYIYSDWTNLIYNELSTNGPVLFGGQSVGGGHAFLLDGYDGEDYFHVNWGWGGQSDGFYRLSALTPSEQGAGGSSTSDGFNYDQVVMVNVKPQDDGISEYDDVKLTVNTWTAKYSSLTNVDGKFYFKNGNTYYPQQVNFSLTNNTGRTNTFEWGIAFVSEGEIVKVLNDITKSELSSGSTTYGQTASLTITDDNLANGVYEIVAVSRKAGTTTWHKCSGSEFYYIKATISDNTMTLENVADNQEPVLSATLELDGNAYVGQTTTIKAKITNTGGLYIGTTQLLLYKNETYYKLSYKQLDVEGGDTDKEFDFTFKPNETGTWNLVLLDKNNNKIGEKSIEVTTAPEEPAATTGTLEIVSTALKNGNFDATPGKVYGPTVHAAVTVKNTGNTVHSSGIRIYLLHWTIVDDNQMSGRSISSKDLDLSLAPAESITLDVELSGMEIGDNLYGLAYCYTDNTQFESSSYFKATEGIEIVAADGTTTAIEKTATVETPSGALVLDLSQVDGVTSVTPNSNPNTLYIVSGNAPTGLEGKNVVVNGTAETLTLSDGNAFYSPTNFTATEVSYTRTFEHGADGANGWYTIMLPFDVTSITCTKNGVKKELHWFTSDESSGDFWLKTFSSEDGTTVNFGYASSFEANTPYIIAVPGNTWGDAWDLRNIEITFHGSAAGIGVTAPASVSGDNYKFTGSTMTQSVSDSYMLTDGGKDFIKGSGVVAPFRAYFKPFGAASAAASRLLIGSERPTAITPNFTLPTRPGGQYYNLNGQRVTQPGKGLYIVDGKKVLVK